MRPFAKTNRFCKFGDHSNTQRKSTKCYPPITRVLMVTQDFKMRLGRFDMLGPRLFRFCTSRMICVCSLKRSLCFSSRPAGQNTSPPKHSEIQHRRKKRGEKRKKTKRRKKNGAVAKSSRRRAPAAPRSVFRCFSSLLRGERPHRVEALQRLLRDAAQLRHRVLDRWSWTVHTVHGSPFSQPERLPPTPNTRPLFRVSCRPSTKKRYLPWKPDLFSQKYPEKGGYFE